MNKFISLILCFFLGLLLYKLVVSNFCNCNIKEGMGKVNLGNCCPLQHIWDTKNKKCVKICDGCDIDSYGKIKYEVLKQKIKSGAVEEVIHYYTCNDNDASNVYNYKSLNGIYDYGELTDQYNYTGAVHESDIDMVVASEEGSNESWANVGLDPPKGRYGQGEQGLNTGIFPFYGLDTNVYYSSGEACNSDYDAQQGSQKIDKPKNCKGHWVLDNYDKRFTFIKDNGGHTGTPPFVIDSPEEIKKQNPEQGSKSILGELGVTEEQYYKSYYDQIEGIVNGMDNSAPVKQYYDVYINWYKSKYP